MRRRRLDDGDLIPLELDDADAAPEGEIVEVGGGDRRRRRDLGLAAVVVVAVAAIGLLGDDPPRDERAGADTTTTIRRRSPATTQRRVTTTTLPVGTVIIQPGGGPVVEGPTGSALTWLSPRGDEAVVLDLDTGRRCTIRIQATQGAWMDRSLGDAVLVYGGNSGLVLRSDCSQMVIPAQQAESIPSDRPGHVWLAPWTDGDRTLREVAVGGEASGREVRVPAATGGIHAVDGGVVVDVFGSVTFIDPDNGAGREIGKGFVFAASGRLVALVECEALRCDVVVRDLDGREVRRVRDERPSGVWNVAALSPDGRWLAYQRPGEAGIPEVVVLDLDSGQVRELDRSNGTRPAFTATGSHLVAGTTSGLRLFPLGGGEPIALDDVPPNAAHSFAVLERAG